MSALNLSNPSFRKMPMTKGMVTNSY